MTCCSVGLVQLIRFLVVELIYLDLNYRFDMIIIFMTNYFLVEGNILIDSETLFVTDFVNLKIKSAQSFRSANNNRMCVHIFIEIDCSYIYKYLYLYCVFKKKCYMLLPDAQDYCALKVEIESASISFSPGTMHLFVHLNSKCCDSSRGKKENKPPSKSTANTPPTGRVMAGGGAGEAAPIARLPEFLLPYTWHRWHHASSWQLVRAP
jgi:hypothetical protein